MSISICWAPVRIKPPKTFDGTSSMWNALREVFGGGTPNLVLSGPNILLLRAMAAAQPANGFYNSIADAIETHGSIEVWAEY